MKYLIAHDLGTSGNKATLFTIDGNLVTSVNYTYNTKFFNANWAEQNPNDWYNAVCESNKLLLKKANVNNKDVASLSFSGQMMGCVLVDKNHNALRNAIIWSDQRSVEQEKKIRNKIKEEDFYKITGHKISASYGIEKLMWIKDNEPDIYNKTYKMINPKDYIIGRLVGEFITDYSDASGTNCFDINNNEWSDKLLDIAEIPRELMPKAVLSTHVAGEIGDKISKECGLAPGTPIIVGAGDGVSASVGANSITEGSVYNYLGSSSWISLCSSKPIYDDKLRTFTWAHMVPGMYVPTGTMQAAGNSYNFVKNVFCDGLVKDDTQNIYEIIDDLISKGSPGANGLIYLPYILGERSPRWNPNARGSFVGLKMEHTKADILRATVEGVLMNLSIIVDIFKNEVNFNEITVIGGLAQSKPLFQILSDIYGVPAYKLIHLEEATSMGAAICAGVGAGIFKDFTVVNKFIKKDTVINPNLENNKKYNQIKEIFNETYDALINVYDKLAKV